MLAISASPRRRALRKRAARFVPRHRSGGCRPHCHGAFTPDGHVNEDVFAHSNRFNDQRGLVLYQNKYAQTSGWIKTSAAYMDKGSGNLVQRTLGEGLALPQDGFTIFKDYVTGLEYIRSCRELWEQGLYAELGAYQCQVFLDWRFVEGEQWAKVFNALNGAGVPSMQAKWDELFGVKEGVVEEKPKKPAKKWTTKTTGIKKTTTKKKTTGQKSTKKTKPKT